jgi:hypothetical protein
MQRRKTNSDNAHALTVWLEMVRLVKAPWSFVVLDYFFSIFDQRIYDSALGGVTYCGCLQQNGFDFTGVNVEDSNPPDVVLHPARTRRTTAIIAHQYPVFSGHPPLNVVVN